MGNSNLDYLLRDDDLPVVPRIQEPMGLDPLELLAWYLSGTRAFQRENLDRILVLAIQLLQSGDMDWECWDLLILRNARKRNSVA
jgi:hypothetical protein